MKQKINTNSSNIITNEKRIVSLKSMSDKNYERFLSSKINESKYENYDKKFDAEIDKLNEDNKNLKESIRAIKNSLNNEILHYSDDLPTFKTQLLKSLEWIEIKEELAIIKIKGWGKQVIFIYREAKLYLYNKS